MHDAVEHIAIALTFGGVAKNATTERRPIEGATRAAVRRRQEKVGRRGEEVAADGVVAASSGFDNFAGEEVGVNHGEKVRRLGENLRDSGLASCDRTGEANEEHSQGLFRSDIEVTYGGAG